MHRSSRSTRHQLIAAEAHQKEVISALASAGHHDITERLQRCQHARQHRRDGWPWRCHGAGCWSCRRTIVGRWWTMLDDWLGVPTSMAIIPTGAIALDHVRKVKKGSR